MGKVVFNYLYIVRNIMLISTKKNIKCQITENVMLPSQLTWSIYKISQHHNWYQIYMHPPLDSWLISGSRININHRQLNNTIWLSIVTLKHVIKLRQYVIINLNIHEIDDFAIESRNASLPFRTSKQKKKLPPTKRQTLCSLVCFGE